MYPEVGEDKMDRRDSGIDIINILEFDYLWNVMKY
jgi:hypothetical protein